ncbi:uncharacterized protein Z519_08038 [Cladophialophora bantiana CBS 173.52]|uniref:Phospholipase n=1 Tax=Cladophialophora bantiana (strain ATCC 10958 / CBS 173.52 / CDC B-1940 / NIH 8579) TaxID=1442370 RepID=A0A0D2I2N2_CLAB1|nr:uncharacterized protein Z519_08038 [Cladophialophora bantiana CBS 173.52]KIW91144.1 hypothetical protein Z519_08038 [Cladophialophora bantiana CBS 173.52]
MTPQTPPPTSDRVAATGGGGDAASVAARLVRDDPEKNPNSLHDFHTVKRGPKNVPAVVMPTPTSSTEERKRPKNPGHSYAHTEHVRFDYFNQRASNAPFGYEHFVSLPPSYAEDSAKAWPLVLFLHGAGESQRGR